jgi:hypothetical protein
LFNPVSVADAITSYIDNSCITKDDLFYFNEGWHSWKHHSRFSASTAEEALAKINTSTKNAHDFLKTADYILITLGSAWIYTLTTNALNAKLPSVAANNHKAPSDWFLRRLMTPEEVLQGMDSLIQRLFRFNDKLKIIFTISPVRHLRDGVVENNQSKARLIEVVHHLVNKFDGLYYFPAYELVIDVLRDYRFYDIDMVHPNYPATEFVLEKFIQSCIDEPSQKIMDEVRKVVVARKHRPFQPSTNAHKQFLSTHLEKAKDLQKRYPFLDLGEEIKYFSNTQP